MMGDVIKEVVNVEELQEVRVNLECPQENCWERFGSSSNLAMHLAKRHKVEGHFEQKKSKKVQFCCPTDGCKYGLNGGLSFKRKTLLKQHYLKVHAPRNFPCPQCGRALYSGAALARHQRDCGRALHCPLCLAPFTSREALATHRRRKHPKPESCHLLAAMALSELSRKVTTRDIAVQTPSPRHGSHGRVKDVTILLRPSYKSSAQTQTHRGVATAPSSKQQRTSETQTPKDMMPASRSRQHSRQPSSSYTQTPPALRVIAARPVAVQTTCTTAINIVTTAVTSAVQSETNLPITTVSTTSQCDVLPSNGSNETSPQADEQLPELLQSELKTANLTEIESEMAEDKDVEFASARSLIKDASLPDIWFNQKSTQTSLPEAIFSAESRFTDSMLLQSSETQTDWADYDFLEEVGSSLGPDLEDMCTQTCDLLFADIQTQTWSPDNPEAE